MHDFTLKVGKRLHHVASNDDMISKSSSFVDTFCSKMEIEAKDVLVLSSEKTMLTTGRNAGCMTCCYERSKNSRGYFPVDFKLKSLKEVKHIVEELNGISYRK